jgi:hypothetical protein
MDLENAHDDLAGYVSVVLFASGSGLQAQGARVEFPIRQKKCGVFGGMASVNTKSSEATALADVRLGLG